MNITSKMEPCRACMMHGDLDEMHIFDSASSFAYGLLTAIDVERDDGMPRQMCMECLGKLQMFQDFRDTCIASDTMFQMGKNMQLAATDDDLEMTDFCDHNDMISFSPVNDLDDVPIKQEDTVPTPATDIEDNKNHPPDDTELLEKYVIIKSVRHRPNNTSPEKPADVPVHFECDICSKVCFKKHRMVAHLREHCGLKPFGCEPCGMSFQKWGTYRQHNRKHHAGEAPIDMYACDFDGCTKLFEHRHTLKTHHDRVHLGIKRTAEVKRKCICETCGKSFKSMFFLRDHRYTHLDKKFWPIGCDLCPKRFISNYKFKIHMLRHNNIKNFACTMCEMRTCTKKELEIHIAYHNKEASFECDSCASAFRSKIALQRHKRIVHRGYKPYVCTFCDLTFAKADTLKHHTMRHTGEKPHACTHCDRRFIQVVALRAHLKTHDKHKLPNPQTVST